MQKTISLLLCDVFYIIFPLLVKWICNIFNMQNCACYETVKKTQHDQHICAFVKFIVFTNLVQRAPNGLSTTSEITMKYEIMDTEARVKLENRAGAQLFLCNLTAALTLPGENPVEPLQYGKKCLVMVKLLHLWFCLSSVFNWSSNELWPFCWTRTVILIKKWL